MQATSGAGAVSAPRKMRADAQRNYEKILAVAREVFGESGANASLDEIAKRAGVGPGTLYRHFPTRADLHLAVLQDWITDVQAEADRLAGLDDPAVALDEWFHRYIGYKNFFRGLHVALLEGADADADERPALNFCRGLLSDTSATVIGRAKAAGLVREDLDPKTVMQMVSGIAFLIDQAPGGVDVESQLAIIKAGIRPAG
jgi:AcrR family transcriptional regulator